MKKRLLLSLATLLAVNSILTGCTDNVTTNRTLPEFSEDDHIYRSAWWCPKPTAENYTLYQDCELNAVLLANHNFLFEHENFWERDDRLSIVTDEAYYIGHPVGYEKENATDKALALAKELGLYVWVADGSSYFGYAGEDINVFKDFTFDYEQYEDQILGIFAGDEPSLPAISDIAKKVPDALEKFPNLPYFSNLFPYYADLKTQIQSDSYPEYIKTYCQEMFKNQKEHLISVDFYPFRGNNQLYWLFNYHLVQEEAAKYNADIHYFIQSCLKSDGSYASINENDLRLQVNVALAYGAKQYSYYVYDVPFGASYLSGLVDLEGKPVEMYQFAKNVNTEVKSLEKAFAHYDVAGTFPIADTEAAYNSGSFSMLPKALAAEVLEKSAILSEITSTNRGLVTLLRDEEGNEAFYLVNYYDRDDGEATADCTFTLTFNGMKHVALYGSTDLLDGECESLKNGIYSCTLAPGEGILVVPTVTPPSPKLSTAK